MLVCLLKIYDYFFSENVFCPLSQKHSSIKLHKNIINKKKKMKQMKNSAQLNEAFWIGAWKKLKSTMKI